ncbi:TlpA family protein disulfide reductase [Roseibium sediminicola]|uniref:TlpA family protein disulfide reductase n=1 Tax=Roseibium sediminicola TaxID=2933272 RepID=A0ABT0GU66_9HYPH|nr:TlpA disulfide reductase family protein [Roseibium sp. CAU 1639]MCK7612984.1 TlpA family protein disulfide reductase [Roseibium sp. CAU 1639]
MTDLSRRHLLAGGAALALASSAAVAANTDYRQLGLLEPAFEIDPKLDIADLAGTTHRIGDYAGKVLIVSFWATWCPPCRKEMPSLARLARVLGPDGYAVLAVNVGDQEDKVRGFLDEIDSDGFTVLLDSNKSMPSTWYLRGLPVTYILNRDGAVALAAVGDRVWDSDEMVAAIRTVG